MFFSDPDLWLPQGRASPNKNAFSNTTRGKPDMGGTWIPPCSRQRQDSPWEGCLTVRQKAPLAVDTVSCSTLTLLRLLFHSPFLGPGERSCFLPSDNQGQNIPHSLTVKDRKRIKMLKSSFRASTSLTNYRPKNLSIPVGSGAGILLKIGFNPSSWAPWSSPAHPCSPHLPQSLISLTLSTAPLEVE